MRVSLRPDPRKGVFETLLVLDGRPVELRAHMERLGASLDRLYGAGLPADASNEVVARARAIRHGRLRLTVSPGEKGLRTRIGTGEVPEDEVFPGPERGVALRSFVVEAGLGDHKWADRRLLEHAAAARPGELPLLVDDQRTVLEASRGNVFAVLADGRLRTPPTDGRILPGIARRQVLELARRGGIDAGEERLTLADLGEASEVFLAGSVRGVEPVRSLDGVDLPPPGEVSALVAAGLRRRWLRVPQGEAAAVAAGGRRAGPPGR